MLKKHEKKYNESNKKTLIQPVGCLYHFNWYEAEDVTDEFIKFLNSNFIKDFTDYYSDIFEFEIELKVIASVSELKKNYKNLKNVISVEKDEKDISRILESFEEYEKLKNDFPENLDMVLENSSVIKDSDELKMKNRKNSILYWLIKLLNEKGYVF